MAKNNTSKKTAKKDKQPDIVIDNTKLKLTLVWKDIEAEYNKVLKNSATNIKAQGFRKGKTPLKIAEEKIGKERLVNKVLELLIPPKYETLIKKEGKKPLTQPEVKPLSMKWGEDWELEIHIAEKPVLKLGSYKKSVKKGLKEALKQLKEQKAQADKNSKNKDQKSPQPTKEQIEAKERETKLQQIFRALVEDIQPQIPELLLKEETKREIQRLAKELEKMGLSLDDYLARQNQKFEDMSSQVAAQVLGQLQLEFVLREIEENEKIEVTDKDKKDELEKIEDKKLRQQIENDHHYLDHLNRQISRRKLVDYLLEIK